jgi:xylulose-5-phosphate/fructose-6-phosphate phosphoketolase
MTAQNNLSDIVKPEVLISLTKYLRLANYLSAAQLYLKDNFLLERELTIEDVKPRVLGHWGTVPGLNFIYANLNILVKRHDLNSMLIIGPGHGYPSLLSNLYMEGTLGKYYKGFQYSKMALGNLVKGFSWPRAFPSHSNPETPGVILEGGELGYALGSAFGAAFDNPDLIVTCVVGDGEAETASTAGAWHSTKFLNPKTSGAVLPIVHINKFKISGPTIYGTMSDDELNNLFEGYGYDPIIIKGDFLFEPMLNSMEEAYQKIKYIQKQARENGIIDKPKWPVILLITKKGWTGPKELDGKKIEDGFRSHGVPLEEVHKDPKQFALLKSWLESYKVQELLNEDCSPIDEIMSIFPDEEKRLGRNKHANGEYLHKLNLPKLKDFEVKFEIPGKTTKQNLTELSKYLAEVVKLNPEDFRVFSPDESISNKLNTLFEVTKRAYIWPVPENSENMGTEGRLMEVLSENLLMSWMQGYTLTGRQSIFVSYEAFMMIVASMVDQYLKFMFQKKEIAWRKPVPSLNIILTSSSWRQEHNGISHQNPGFISSLLNNNNKGVRIHYPADANMLLATMEECLQSTDKVNVIVCGKRDLPQYLSIQDAKTQMKEGIGVWDGASNGSDNPDVVFAATGDYMTLESLAAIKLLEKMAPQIKTRFVSVSELSHLNIGELSNPGQTSFELFNKYFTPDKHIIYSYHGYKEDIEGLLFKNPRADKIHIHSYKERGTTTTPFDMLVLNNCSRYQLILEAVHYYTLEHPDFIEKEKSIFAYITTLLAKHEAYIIENGKDIPEINNFTLD